MSKFKQEILDETIEELKNLNIVKLNQTKQFIKNINKYERNKETTAKKPCFKCVVRNFPGGRMGRVVCSPCDDCEAKNKEQEKRQHERYLAETNVGVDKEWKYKNSKCETCQMSFSQMKDKNIPQRILNDKLYCQEHYDKVLTAKAKEDTEKQKQERERILNHGNKIKR